MELAVGVGNGHQAPWMCKYTVEARQWADLIRLQEKCHLARIAGIVTLGAMTSAMDTKRGKCVWRKSTINEKNTTQSRSYNTIPSIIDKLINNC
jgi:hypothetical protein